MNLRGKNFVGQIFDMPVIKATIKGLLGGDKYYFYLNINGRNRVLYIDVIEYSDGVAFKLYKDNTRFTENKSYEYIQNPIGDELVKVIKSTTEDEVADGKITIFSATPEADMANYVDIYIDAIQTVKPIE